MQTSGVWVDPAENAPLVSMRGVTKSFARGLARASRRTLAIADVDFEVFPREIVLVTGGEGCGKTTLLQCACGILRAERGEVSHCGPHYVPAVPVYYPFLTVSDVLSFRGASKQVIENLISAFDLRPFANQVVANLSSAAVRRVAIAESLVGAPSIVMIDTGTFDVPSPATVAAVVAAGASAVIAARNGSSIAHLATRIVCLAEGRVTRVFSMSRSLVAERIH